jgi:hypothetical protein
MSKTSVNVNPRCCVPCCTKIADYEVLFEDIYLYDDDESFFRAQHAYCNFICDHHRRENDAGISDPVVMPRNVLTYPHTNSTGHGTVGYRCLRQTAEHMPGQFISPLTQWALDNGYNPERMRCVGKYTPHPSCG